MSAAALSPDKKRAHTSPTFGLRPVRLRQDLGAIADLVELAFGSSMDAGGRAAVREMRALSRSGPLLWLIAGVDRAVRSLMRGFVWIDPGTERLVGNVSIYPAGYDNFWVIANVAVHPDFRRRGIAQEMVHTALDFAEQQRASGVILQVEADNEGAQRLYTRLGFRTLRSFTRWRRRPYLDPPLALPDMPDLTFRSVREWRAELALAEQVRPESRGGMGWLRPTDPREFRPALLRGPGGLFGLKQVERWVVRDPCDEGRLLASMRMESGFGAAYTRADLLVAPEQQGILEWPLVNFLIRYCADRRSGVLTDHPSDDEAATAAFEANRFEVVRQLVHMRWMPRRQPVVPV